MASWRGERCRDQQAPFAFAAYGDLTASGSGDYSSDRNCLFELVTRKDSRALWWGVADLTLRRAMQGSDVSRHEACLIVNSRDVSFRNAFVLKLYVIVP